MNTPDVYETGYEAGREVGRLEGSMNGYRVGLGEAALDLRVATTREGRSSAIFWGPIDAGASLWAIASGNYIAAVITALVFVLIVVGGVQLHRDHKEAVAARKAWDRWEELRMP
jgi:hypothetical protein